MTKKPSVPECFALVLPVDQEGMVLLIEEYDLGAENMAADNSRWESDQGYT